MTSSTTIVPKVYIADLAAYNNGKLHGKWVSALDVDELNEAVQEVIKTSPEPFAEEFAVHDYDGFGELTYRLGEYPSLEMVARIGSNIFEYGDAYLAYLEACEVDLNDWEETSEEAFYSHYRGEWDSEEAFAQDYVCEVDGWAGVPAVIDLGGFAGARNVINVFDQLSGYLDWETIARDLFQHGNYTYCGGHVFEDEV